MDSREEGEAWKCGMAEFPDESVIHWGTPRKQWPIAAVLGLSCPPSPSPRRSVFKSAPRQSRWNRGSGARVLGFGQNSEPLGRLHQAGGLSYSSSLRFKLYKKLKTLLKWWIKKWDSGKWKPYIRNLEVALIFRWLRIGTLMGACMYIILLIPQKYKGKAWGSWVHDQELCTSALLPRGCVAGQEARPKVISSEKEELPEHTLSLHVSLLARWSLTDGLTGNSVNRYALWRLLTECIWKLAGHHV